jgi:hypothetical protein
MKKVVYFIQDFLALKPFSFIFNFFNTILFIYFVWSIRCFTIYFLCREYCIGKKLCYTLSFIFILWCGLLIWFWYTKGNKNRITWWNIILCIGFCIVITTNPGVYTQDITFWFTPEGMINFSKPLICNLYWSIWTLYKYDWCTFWSFVEFLLVCLAFVKLWKKKKLVTKMEKYIALLTLSIFFINFSYMFFIKDFGFFSVAIDTKFYYYIIWFIVVFFYMFI